MKIILCADHAGLKLKEQIKQYLLLKNYQIEDVGAFELDADDSYVFYAKQANEKVLENPENMGIFVCGSGVGMSIVANKQKGLRACIGLADNLIQKAREHNNINVLCLGERFIEFDDAKSIVDVFLTTQFLGGKYQNRIDDIE